MTARLPQENGAQAREEAARLLQALGEALEEKRAALLRGVEEGRQERLGKLRLQLQEHRAMLDNSGLVGYAHEVLKETDQPCFVQAAKQLHARWGRCVTPRGPRVRPSHRIPPPWASHPTPMGPIPPHGPSSHPHGLHIRPSHRIPPPWTPIHPIQSHPMDPHIPPPWAPHPVHPIASPPMGPPIPPPRTPIHPPQPHPP